MNGLVKRCLGPSAALLLVAGCQEATGPLGEDRKGPGLPQAAALAELTCTVNVADGDMNCEPVTRQVGGVAGASMDLIVGSQHQFVRMANSTPSMAGGTWTANVTVQNLTLKPMGTEDGSTASGGVLVFFVQEPTNGVEIANHDGSAAFTGSEPQKYYAYSESMLGADSILSPGEVSNPRTWQFTLNGATTFQFSVLVSAPVPSEGDYGVHLSRLSGYQAHTCGDGSNGSVYCWGNNDSGRLGDGTITNRVTPTAVLNPGGVTLSGVAAGAFHTCANGSDGDVYCWGLSYYGQLGNGSSGADAFSAVPVKVNRPGGVALSGVVSGAYSSCARGADGQVYCWGRNDSFQLGDSTTTARSMPVPVRTPLGVTFTSVTAGGVHACAQGNDGSVYCWGENSSGQLGNGGFTNQRVPVPVQAPGGVTLSNAAAGGQHTCAVGSNGSAYCWGLGSSGQIGNGASSSQPTPVAVSAPLGVTLTGLSGGLTHTCAQGSDANAWCWGAGSSGQLGTGSLSPRNTPGQVLRPPTGASLSSVVAAGSHSCAIGSDGKSYCWGSNADRQLGNGRPQSSLTPEIVAGTRRP